MQRRNKGQENTDLKLIKLKDTHRVILENLKKSPGDVRLQKLLFSLNASIRSLSPTTLTVNDKPVASRFRSYSLDENRFFSEKYMFVNSLKISKSKEVEDNEDDELQFHLELGKEPTSPTI